MHDKNFDRALNFHAFRFCQWSHALLHLRVPMIAML